MYKIYDYQRQAYLSENRVPMGHEGAAKEVFKTEDREQADNFLYNYGDNEHQRFDVLSRQDAFNQGIPLDNAYAIHQDTMNDDMKGLLEDYYKGNIEVSMDVMNGHAAVYKDIEDGSYGITYIDVDTQDVFSKGNFEEKEHAMDYADDLREYDFKDIEHDRPDFTIQDEIVEEKTIEMEFDR